MSAIFSYNENTEEAYTRTVQTLRDGALVVAPVGGVYTVLADAFNPEATQRIFIARRAPQHTPLTVLIRAERQVFGIADDVPEPAERVMATYWPGDVTIILPSIPDLPWSLGETAGTVQLRRPQESFLLQVIAEVGPLACSSANRMGTPRPRTVEQAEDNLGDRPALYLDGGARHGGVSTILDCTRSDPRVLRPGRIATRDLLAVAAGKTEWGERPTTTAVDEES